MMASSGDDRDGSLDEPSQPAGQSWMEARGLDDVPPKFSVRGLLIGVTACCLLIFLGPFLGIPQIIVAIGIALIVVFEIVDVLLFFGVFWIVDTIREQGPKRSRDRQERTDDP